MRFGWILLALAVSACAVPSSADVTTPVAAESPTEATPSEPVPVAAVYPAPHPAGPRVVSRGGPVLASPKVIPIFFGSDPLQGRIEAFLRELASSTYWEAVTKEYGVGSLTIAPSVVSE